MGHSSVISVLMVFLSFFLSLIPIALALFVDYIVAKKMEAVAVSKGHPGKVSFHLCFWLGVVGYLYVVALPDLIERENSKRIVQLLERKETAD